MQKLFCVHNHSCTWKKVGRFIEAVAHANTAPEHLREQLLLSYGPTFFHVHEWLCTQNKICVSRTQLSMSNFGPCLIIDNSFLECITDLLFSRKENKQTYREYILCTV